MSTDSRPHGVSRPDACSVMWDGAVGSSLYGTAAPARFWVALEQSGPWGRQAATQSHLDPGLGARLERACAAHGGRLSLIRSPGDHPDDARAGRHVLVGWTGTDAAPGFLLGGVLGSAEQLEALDLEALARGDLGATTASLPVLAPCPPALLVCTNGRRDVCCAVRGRPVAAAGHAAYPGRVWECSHTGGHRFSPTGVLLPWGRTLGRLDDAAVVAALDAADDGRLAPTLLGPWHDRGASALGPREQAAESAVRDLVGDTDPLSLTVTSLPGPEVAEGAVGSVAVRHRDGRRWVVDLTFHTGEAKRNSCADGPVPERSWTTTVRPAVPR